MHVLTLILALPLGLVVGISLGALGGGGSILTVPALVYVLAQPPSTATTSSLIIVGLTTLIGLAPHLRAGRVRLGQGIVFGLLGTAGAYAGSALSAGVPSRVLLLSFAALMLVVAVLMTRRRRRAAIGGAAVGGGGADTPMLTLRPFQLQLGRAALLLGTATGVGLLTGFFGVGGGFAVVPALVLALQLPMPVAVGTSLVVITINSATALTSRLGAGLHADWALVAVFAGAAIIGSLVGSRIAGRVSPIRLNLWFTILLIAVALYTAYSSIIQFR